ncbi:hypothetical protein N2152v2_007346 [Parachlorella kessleri]
MRPRSGRWAQASVVSVHSSSINAAAALAELASEPPLEKEDKWAVGAATDLEGEHQSFASLLGAETDEEPEVVDESLMLVNCGLSEVTVKALEEKGIFSLFPVQKQVFTPAMDGSDMICRAKTGSGKTLAFALPVIEKIMAAKSAEGGRPKPHPRCLVLAPTRELAKQVEREFQSAAPTLRVGCYYGGTPIGPQLRELRSGVEVVVGTPGRVIDLIDQDSLDLGRVGFVILDEADQMLNVGFEKDVETILNNVPQERQTMLFSATMPHWVKKLVKSYLNDPITVDLVGEGQSGKMADSITALAVQVTDESRRSVLVDILTVYGEGGKAMVFTQTKREADEVAAAVGSHLLCAALHGDMSQREREKVLESFREGKTSVLVATDVAARGLDITDVDLVVHYELPQDPEAFLHRSGAGEEGLLGGGWLVGWEEEPAEGQLLGALTSLLSGRTGRAGKSGTTIAMFTRREIGYFKRILRETETSNVAMISAPSPAEVVEAAAKQVMNRLDGVDPEVKSYFSNVAKLILDSRNPQDAMEAALAALSGIKEVPEPRSLLTLEQGLVTLRMMSQAGRITRPQHIHAIVSRLLNNHDKAAQVGRIRLLAEPQNRLEGAAFDVPPMLAQEILALEGELSKRGVTLTQPATLPPEEELYGGRSGGRGGRDGDDDFFERRRLSKGGSFDRGGRGGRGSSSRGGGGGRSGGYGGSRDSGRDGGSFEWGRDRRSDRGGSGGRGRGGDSGGGRGRGWDFDDDRKSSFGGSRGGRSSSKSGKFSGGW